MLNNVTFWTTIATAAVGVITTILTIITSTKKSKSQKLVALAKVVQKLPEYISEAEQIIGTGNGVAKLAWVLQKVQMNCIMNKVEYIEEDFKAEIEKILETPEKKEVI